MPTRPSSFLWVLTLPQNGDAMPFIAQIPKPPAEPPPEPVPERPPDLPPDMPPPPIRPPNPTPPPAA